ncbi:MAG TPA: hypothetical protein VKJ00_11495 [Thermoanaerobaculia bacterium]|nr:hypothetical protein [Thermoanaerobaculia bacterium]
MSLMDNLGSIVDQFKRGGASDEDVHAAYDQVAHQVPKGNLAAGLSHAFKSDQTPPFEQMVSGLFGQSNSDQKAGLLNQLLGSLGPGGGSQILSSLGLGGLAGALGGGAVTHQQAQEVSPEAVQSLARQAAAKDPSIMDKAAGFYAQHPTLVKTIGAGALAILMSKMSAERRS